MIILVYLFIILSIGLIGIGVAGTRSDMGARLRLPGENVSRKVQTTSFLTRIFPFSRIILERFNLEEKLKNKLNASHVRLNSVEFFNMKLLFMVIMIVAARLATGEFNPFVFIVAILAGYIIPDIYLRRKLAKRKHMIARLLPETVDLLGLCVEAGLDFTTAVKWVVDKIPQNPMLEELAFVLEEIKWGKPRTHALKDMSKRLRIPEMSTFVQALVQAERMGTPVAETFAIISEDTRLQRFHQGERFAMQAPIKILIPLIFCILPVIGIIIGAPIFLQFMQGGILKGIGG